MTTTTTHATVVDAAIAMPHLSTLVTAIETAGLVDALSGEGSFTVFAPTDEAFDKLPEGTLESVLKDIPTLTSILEYHVVPYRYLASDVMRHHTLPTLLDKDLTVKVSDGVWIGDAMVVGPDIETGNGVIHVIDTVLLPE